MTQEDKDILLKDLCARFPYEVKVNVDTQGDFTLIGLTKKSAFTNSGIEGCYNAFSIESIKPYLFPLSGMTDEQREEFIKFADYETKLEDCGRHKELYYCDLVGHENNLYHNSDAIDWLNKNHFDYRNLIDKNLAMDCTNLNIY